MNYDIELISEPLILRDFLDNIKYVNDEHEALVDIADALYNAGLQRENLLPKYQALYDKMGRDFWAAVVKDAVAIDDQMTTANHEHELAEEYAEKVANYE